MTRVEPCWHVEHDGLEGIVTLDEHGRPIAVHAIDPDVLTIPNAKKLTSQTVLNAITAQKALDITA